jgi:hypothetical protein
MPDFIEIDHPCLRRTKVPIYARPAAKSDMSDPPSETLLSTLAYIFRDVPIQPEEA